MTIYMPLLADSFLADLACCDTDNRCFGYFGHGRHDGDGPKVRKSDPGSKQATSADFIDTTFTETFLVVCGRKINWKIQEMAKSAVVDAMLWSISTCRALIRGWISIERIFLSESFKANLVRRDAGNVSSRHIEHGGLDGDVSDTLQSGNDRDQFISTIYCGG